MTICRAINLPRDIGEDAEYSNLGMGLLGRKYAFPYVQVSHSKLWSKSASPIPWA